MSSSSGQRSSRPLLSSASASRRSSSSSAGSSRVVALNRSSIIPKDAALSLQPSSIQQPSRRPSLASSSSSAAVILPRRPTAPSSFTPESAMALHAMHSALEQFGPAPGARVMLNAEMDAAEHSALSGIYISFRCMRSNPIKKSTSSSESLIGQDCTRCGPQSMCFCGHLLHDHSSLSMTSSSASSSLLKSKKKVPGFIPCMNCPCKAFRYIHTRPEEIGEWWLVRRKDFDLSTYTVKCKCGHGPGSHGPVDMRCRACISCFRFESNFLCVACDNHWEDHETVIETEQERRAAGRPIGDDNKPFAELPEFQNLVFNRPPPKRSSSVVRKR